MCPMVGPAIVAGLPLGPGYRAEVRGFEERTVQILEEAGYKSIEEVQKEDEERLIHRTGFSQKRVKSLRTNIVSFLASEDKQLRGRA